MILYSSTIKEFLKDVDTNTICTLLDDSMKKTLYKNATDSEKNSWTNSLEYMANILRSANIEENCSVILEYNLPLTSKRIDFMLLGYNCKKEKTGILFELKQWSSVNSIDNSDILIETYVGNSVKEVVHPAYQVWSYQELLYDFNEFIQEKDVNISSCVVLHNYIKKVNDPLFNDKFNKLLSKVDIFTKNDQDKLINYINNKLCFGDDISIIKDIDSSNLSPSKRLQDNIKNLITKSDNFRLIDEQMVIYDKITALSKSKDKQVIIVDGGPGTGKSLIAVNLLSRLTSYGKLCQYVSRNTAPRVVYSYKLKGTMNKTSIDNLFKTSSTYTDISSNVFDMLVVDEAHLLTEKSGLFNNYGENQIKEIINSSKCSVFFIDERQKVHLNDIGTIKEITKWANFYNSNISMFKLVSQFRCNGSNNYLDFLDYILGINSTYTSGKINYDINVVETPFELESIIKEKNINNLARILAGHCWDWNKKEVENTTYHDIKIDDYGISWNLGVKQTFAIDESINEAGCVHSVQGLEFDYVGVIIGKDMFYEDKLVKTSFQNHASTDPSFKGIKKMYKENKEKALELSNEIIKNMYRILLTRGTKGCFIYCVDKQLNEYLKHCIEAYK